MHRYVVPTTLCLLSVALATAVGWLVVSPNFEPAITCLSLLTAITGLFIDRWLSEKEQRRQLLRALVHEIYMNFGVLQDLAVIRSNAETEGFHMLPRFYNSTLATVAASGTFATDRDLQLWKLMHGWMQRCNEANTRFAATEAFTLNHPTSAASLYEGMSTGQVMVVTRQALVDLAKHLLESYPSEFGIDSDTVLFADAGRTAVA